MTKIENLASEISKELQNYSNYVTEEVEKAKRKTATELKKEIIANAPEDTGDYKLGWRTKKDNERKSIIVYNATDYQVTHLLEHGHVKKSGGERVPAQVHIRPAEERAVTNYLDRIEKAVKE